MKSSLTIFLILLISLSDVFSQETAIPEPTFSQVGGFYENSLTVQLAADSGTIYYTLDGSEPSSASFKYNEGIGIEKNTVVRAKVYHKGKASGIVTHTYLVGRKYTLPVVSIAVNNDDFFSAERGIYAKGCCADSVPPYKGANFWKGWERPINIEFFEEDGELAFNQGAGARIFGGFSKGLPMKSLAIIARKRYGEKRFNYQLFPNKDLKKFKSFILRNSGSDFNKTHFRDALLTDLVEPLDMEIQSYRPVVVYINGVYWGIHNVRDKLNEHYLKYNCGANKDSVDLMKHKNDLQHGNRKYYTSMKKYMEKTEFSSSEEIEHLNTLMDIDNYLNYNITEVYIDNRDAGGNIRYWRPRTETGRWRWILFDTDMSFGISDWKGYKRNTLFKMTNKNTEIWPDPAWSTFIIRKLLENDSVKNVYINRCADHLNSIFSTENVIFKIDSIQDLIKDEMPFHVEKWRSNNVEKWERNVNILRDFATHRPYYMRQHIMERFELTDTFYVEIQNPDLKKGKVQLNSLIIENDFKGVYFGGAPVSLKAIPEQGYRFVGWKDEADLLREVQLDLSKDILLIPQFEEVEMGDFAQQVVLNELSTKHESGDWVELYNNSNEEISLSGWTMSMSNDEVFIFGQEASISANGYLVIPRKAVVFNSIYLDSSINTTSDSLSFGISSKGKLYLLDQNGMLVDTLGFDLKDQFEFDNEDKVIERTKPYVSEGISNWKVVQKPTPGKQNDGFVPEPKDVAESKSSNWVLGGVGVLALLIVGVVFFLKSRKKRLN